MKKRAVLLCALLCALLLSACGGKSTLEGRYLRAAGGTSLIVTETNGPVVLSDQSKDGGLFDGLSSGDRIEITHDGIGETYPGQTGAYSCRLLEEGTLDDIPEETLADLEGLGWDFGRHVHAPAAEPETVDDPVSGYCGNTVTTVTLDGEEYSFWGGGSVDLTDILLNLAYDPAQVCRCAAEFTVDTEFGTGYGVSLTESFARCGAGQAGLTAEQTETIRDILARNCGGVTVTNAAAETFLCTGDAARGLTELLGGLSYDGGVCKCLPEYTAETAGACYGVNLTERYVRLEDRQAALTEEQAALLTELFARSGVA